MSDRRRQSLLRLEALGGLSEHYREVATPRVQSFAPRGPIETNKQNWDVDSVSSERSTTVVIFDNPPPPGEDSHDSIMSRRLRQAYPKEGPGETFDGEQYVTAHHPRSAVPSPAMRDYEVRPTSKRNSNWQPQQPPYTQVPNNSGSSRPVSSYAAYEPLSQKPRARNQSNRARNHVQPSQANELPELNNNRGSRGRSRTSTPTAPPHRRSLKDDPLVDNLGFELAASSTRYRSSSTQPPPSPRPSPSTSSSREPSPSRGAWHSEHPRQKRTSFIDRAQERMSRSIHMHLVKAGRRPPPHFEVLSVAKSPVEDVAAWQTKSPTLPPQNPGRTPSPTSGARARATPGGASRRSSPSHRQAAAPCRHQLRQKASAELFVPTRQPRASGLFDPDWTAAAQEKPRPAGPGLRVDTRIFELPAEPQPVELEAPLSLSDFAGVGVAIGSPADASFFAAEHAQKQKQEEQMFELPTGLEEEMLRADDRRALPSQVRWAEHCRKMREEREEMAVSPSLGRKKGRWSLRYGEF
ncbi:hypothetical protein F4810DRAFT_479079 [Camillea tinctor]|nr:hypothetical protein F4810DRAFT_479079 [Camillea tinctor]